MTTVTEARLYI